ncbi:MAG TPA: glycosyltransferase [Gemmataceae bacterium]|jgi:glycosyltransferase involved in cell wall biosynthesis
MRILNLIQCTELGGMEQSSLRIMLGLQARGHRCEVVSTNPVGRLGPVLERHGIPAEGVPFGGRAGWRTHLRLRAAVRRHPADAVLMTGPTLTGMLCLGRAGRPRQVLNVQYHHGGEKHPWSWRALYTLALTRFSAIAFVSDFIRAEAEALCPGVKRVAHTVRNPVVLPPLPDAAASRAARADLGLPADAPVVGNAGWLIPRKRFDVFLRVAARIRQAVPDAVFVVAGDGPERAALETLAAELGVAPAVRWLGWRRDLTPLYQALDLLVFNTDWDAFPTTPLEAMSYAVPVVASSVHGGLDEVLSGPDYGTLLRGHDDAALAEAAVALLRDRAAARRVGRAARDHVARICSLESRARAYERLLSAGQTRETDRPR